MAGKPIGSVHSDFIGVHASESANAWRNMARVGEPPHAFARAILGAWQIARDRLERGGDFAHWEPLPLDQHLKAVPAAPAATLLAQLEEAVRGNPAGPRRRHRRQLRRPGTRAAGRLRPAAPLRHQRRRCPARRKIVPHRQRGIRRRLPRLPVAPPETGLARVTASEFGRPAAGVAQARELLGLAGHGA